MQNLYVISLQNAAGTMVSLGIVAETRAAAESAACTLAGVADGTEPQTSQTLHVVDHIVT